MHHFYDDPAGDMCQSLIALGATLIRLKLLKKVQKFYNYRWDFVYRELARKEKISNYLQSLQSHRLTPIQELCQQKNKYQSP